jgi:hypothetical protein
LEGDEFFCELSGGCSIVSGLPWFTHARLDFAPVAGFSWWPLAQTEYRTPQLNRAGYGRTCSDVEISLLMRLT